MRLALLLLALAAALSLLSLRVQNFGAPGAEVIEAERRGGRPDDTAALENEALTAEIAPPSERPSAPPLFRALQPPAETQAPASGERFALIGLAGQPGARIAFLRDLGDQSNLRLREGGYAGAWRVAEISDRCVTLRRERNEQSICLQ